MIPLGVDEVDKKMDGVAGMDAMTTFWEVNKTGLVEGGRGDKVSSVHLSPRLFTCVL